MLSLVTPRTLALAAAVGSLAATARASVIVESSMRTTWALAGVPEDGGGLDTDTSPAIGPLTLMSSMGPTTARIFASITHESDSSIAGIAGTIHLSQFGIEPWSEVYSWAHAGVWVWHRMTFVVDAPTPYRMEVATLASTWEIPPIYGLAIAAGAATSFDGGSTVVLSQVVPPVAGTSFVQGVLQPGRYTALFEFSSTYFGPNDFILATASLSYGLTIPAPGSAVLLVAGGRIAARRRRSSQEAETGCQIRTGGPYLG